MVFKSKYWELIEEENQEDRLVCKICGKAYYRIEPSKTFISHLEEHIRQFKVEKELEEFTKTSGNNSISMDGFEKD